MPVNDIPRLSGHLRCRTARKYAMLLCIGTCNLHLPHLKLEVRQWPESLASSLTRSSLGIRGAVSAALSASLTYRRHGHSNANIARQDCLVSGSLTLHVSKQEAVKRMELGSFLRQLIRTPVGSPPPPRKSCINSALKNKVKLNPHYLQKAIATLEPLTPSSVQGLP